VSDPFATFGPPELCTWRYAPGVCRFQTTDPRFARKLAKRSKAKLVAWSVSSGYLRIFQEVIEPWRARNLVIRYLACANEAFSKRVASLNISRIPLGKASGMWAEIAKVTPCRGLSLSR
jgi:hypothetical protein